MAIGSRIRWSGVVRASIAGGLAALLSAASADAYELKKSKAGQDIHWTTDAVTYHLDSTVDDAADGAAAAITAAAASWSALRGGPALSVVKGGGGESPGFDGLSTVFYAHEGSSLAGGALAVTVLTYDSNGHALDADVIINGRYDFAVLAPGATPPGGVKPISNEAPVFSPLEHTATPFDLHHVIAHELGHTLGLADETVDDTALMFLYTSPGQAAPRAPAADDTSGVASLYATAAAPAGGAGCGASVSPRAPSDAASRLAFALSLGLVAWGLARRRRGIGGRVLGSASLLLTALALLPGEQEARPSPPARLGSAARARVTHVEVSADAAGLFRTRATLQTTACPGGSCPREATVITYGGTIGELHQEVIGSPAPREGDELDVTFDEATSEARLLPR